MEYIPYTCTGAEKAGNANIYEGGVKINTINTSRCHVEWYCATNGYTWDWRDGDPDAPPPEDPPAEPPVATTPA